MQRFELMVVNRHYKNFRTRSSLVEPATLTGYLAACREEAHFAYIIITYEQGYDWKKYVSRYDLKRNAAYS
jgi:hypothetical protein